MSGEHELGEFGGLAGRLAKADFSGESRVREGLRARLLERGAGRSWRAWWLLPAAAAAALLLMVNVGRRAPQPAGQGPSYSLPDDGYGACGRRGLGDINAEERF